MDNIELDLHFSMLVKSRIPLTSLVKLLFQHKMRKFVKSLSVALNSKFGISWRTRAILKKFSFYALADGKTNRKDKFFLY